MHRANCACAAQSLTDRDARMEVVGREREGRGVWLAALRGPGAWPCGGVTGGVVAWHVAAGCHAESRCGVYKQSLVAAPRGCGAGRTPPCSTPQPRTTPTHASANHGAHMGSARWLWLQGAQGVGGEVHAFPTPAPHVTSCTCVPCPSTWLHPTP